ncbi:hypothetical protein JQT90_03490 [Ponticoccus sp. SC6-32]|nr:hypothetical protein [Ponticoccus sp. SC6-38]MBM1250713.1 hypothetical protein [Ponticoccus sp. SC6-33]MBM1255348.1 hypothetical protein [Ponticoccus sp. SC6-60]MBM1277755.1 hypothetical protein [Ponticoccus sp. SC6-36]MBM1392246.1 hypothetical protein [Ponticoccus sp. SC6-32]
MNFEDRIRTVFSIPLGFILGVIGSGVAELASVTSWKIFAIFLGVVALFFLFEWISDKGSLKAMEALSDRSEAELKDIRERKLLGSHSPWPRYLFLISAAVGVLACLVWSPLEILEALT